MQNGKFLPTASVLLCTDEPILAEGLTRVLAGVDAFELAPHCSSIEQLHAELEIQRPDLLLIDLTAEITFNVLTRLQEAASQAKIVLWVHAISTELALQAMSLGVRGILRRTLPIETLVRCLIRVHEGELWFEKSLTDSITSARRYSLTRREGQLVSLLSQGLKNKEIATALAISEGTVKVYLSRLFQKLGVKDRFELALYGLKNLTTGAGTLERPQGEPPQKSLSGRWQTPRSFFLERAHSPQPQADHPRQNITYKI